MEHKSGVTVSESNPSVLELRGSSVSYFHGENKKSPENRSLKFLIFEGEISNFIFEYTLNRKIIKSQLKMNSN